MTFHIILTSMIKQQNGQDYSEQSYNLDHYFDGL